MPIFAVQNKSESKLSGTRFNTASPIPTVDITTPIDLPTIQRKTSCPCGGGCPSCTRAINFQPKLKIGKPNDIYEQEADRVADEVMLMSKSLLQRTTICPECDQDQDDPIQSSLRADQITPLVQRQTEPEEEEEEPTQTKLADIALVQRKVEEPEEEHLQAKGRTKGVLAASSGLESRIDSLRNSGQPLPPSMRAFFEPRFGRDFSDVRIHTDAQAVESAKAVHARAFTTGRDIVFGPGQYAPETDGGRRLLTHELMHVVQQTGRSSDPLFNFPGKIQRTPGVDAKDSWKAVVSKISVPRSADRKKVARRAISRFLAMKSGADLINALWTLFCKGARKCRSKIMVKFVVKLPQGFGSAGGKFGPDIPNQPLYTVWAKSQKPKSPSSRSISLGGTWPGGSPIDFAFLYTDPESYMAATLHHELLHVWFIHARRNAYYPTGHGDVMKGEIDSEFLKKLKKAAADLAKLEGKL